MSCFFCQDYSYKEKYNIDINKKNTNNYTFLETKYNNINENTYINTFSERNHEKDFQIIEYPEKKNTDDTNENNESTILITIDEKNIRNLNKENYIKSINILKYKNEKKDKNFSIKNPFIRNLKKENIENGKFYNKKPNIIYDEYLNNKQEKQILLKLKNKTLKIENNNLKYHKIKNFSERIESKLID